MQEVRGTFICDIDMRPRLSTRTSFCARCAKLAAAVATHANLLSVPGTPCLHGSPRLHHYIKSGIMDFYG